MTPSIRGRLTAWILAWLLVLPALAAARELALADSFAADAQLARARRVPILVFYTRDNCTWCETARNSYLKPLATDPAAAERVLVREVRVGRNAALVDFDGRATTHGRFARAHDVRLTPTLDFLDDRGSRLVEPIVGVRLPDFYGTFIDRAIEESLARLRPETK